jgi:putative glutamine amidotransferase
MREKKPVFGICRGIQLINAALGGTLWQDILSQCGVAHESGKTHAVQAAEGSALEEMFGQCFWVNSLHHQAVRTLAPGLRPAAWSKEGGACLVEAVWHETLPVFAVQWHPERMVKNAVDQTAGPDMAPLFSYFVRLCAAVRAAK